jgi:hypothetical protein
MMSVSDKENPGADWDQRLIDDYYDYRWHRLIDPLCDRMQLWKEGSLSHAEMERTLEEVHQEICEVRCLFRQRTDRLVNLIRHWDSDWFEAWLEKHTPSDEAVSTSGCLEGGLNRCSA